MKLTKAPSHVPPVLQTQFLAIWDMSNTPTAHLSVRITDLRGLNNTNGWKIQRTCGVFLPKLKTQINHSLHQLPAIPQHEEEAEESLLPTFFFPALILNTPYKASCSLPFPILQPRATEQATLTYNATKKPSNSQDSKVPAEWQKTHTPQHTVSSH